MLFQFSFIIPVYALVAALILLISAHTWTLRPTPGATAWSMTMLFCAIYAIGSGLEIAFIEPVMKLAMNRVIYIGSTGFVFFWGIFALQYCKLERWLNRATIALLALMPLIALCLALFAEHHQLLYRAYEFVYEDGLIIGRVVAYGPVFWVWVGYSYLIFAGSWILLLVFLLRSQSIFRGQAGMVILASVAPLLIYFAHLTGITLLGPFDPTILIMAFSGVVMLLAMTQYRFMDIAPIAYDLIFKNVKSGIILIDLKGRVVGMNHAAEKILGCKEKEVMGKPVLDALPYRHLIVPEFLELKEIKTEIILEDVGRWYELQITPLYNRRDKWVGRLVMLYDLTERKQIEKQTLELTLERERVQLLQRFISHMSHDLRTPLTSLKVTQYLLRKELDGQHSVRLDALGQQTQRLMEMIESMLTLLRLEKDELDDLLDLDVNDLVADVIERNRTLVDTKEAQIQFNPGNDLPKIHANKGELILALSNLLVNAIHYTPKDRQISLSTLHDADHVVIRVCDNGIGISAEDVPHIFEHFYRVDEARGTESGGFGLGLTIAKAIVDRHAGVITVQSQVGEGSDFSVRLPVAKAL